MEPTLLPHQMQLRFALAGHDRCGTLEWTLATIRRIGITLESLRFEEDGPEPQATLWVSAPREEMLTLLVHRMNNGVDVAWVRDTWATGVDVTSGEVALSCAA
jgi:hypothetical protein